MSNASPPPGRRRAAPVRRQDCPLAAAAEFFGERWTLLVLRELFYGVDRFDDICEDLGMPRSTLAVRLQTLSDRRLIVAESYREPGQRKRSRYSLTDAGRDLTTTMWAMTEWSEQHLLGRPAPARLVEATSGQALSIVIRNEQGEEVATDDIAWRLDHDS